MNLVKRRISDPRMIKLIKGWLEAGVMDGGAYIEPDGLGAPQGSVISPLLANIYLHAFDKMWQQSRLPGTLIRYADDCVPRAQGIKEAIPVRAAQKMRVGPSEPLCRRRLQTTLSCDGKEPWW